MRATVPTIVDQIAEGATNNDVLAEDAVLRDHGASVLAQQDRHVLERIAAHQEEIGEVAVLDLAELIAYRHQPVPRQMPSAVSWRDRVTRQRPSRVPHFRQIRGSVAPATGLEAID